jgi:hypothetical protein
MNDPTEFLEIAKPNDFKGYLEWRKDNSGITERQLRHHSAADHVHALVHFEHGVPTHG